VVVFRDVSAERLIALEREELVENLNQARSNHEAIVRGSPLAIIAVDREGRVNAWNPAAERLYGWTENEVLGRPLPTIPEESREEFLANLKMALSGEAVSAEVERRRRDGQRLYVRLWAGPRTDGRGQIIDAVAVIADVTEARRAREALERALRDEQEAVHIRENVLAVVSHDLKNPLAAISLNITMLLKRLGADERTRKQLETIARSARRMDRLIADLLDMASLQAGRLALDPHPHEVAPLVDDAVEQLQPQAAEASVRLLRDVALPPGLTVRCDRDRVLQVFGNLIGNALKFSPAEGAVTVRARSGPGEVQLAVADQGPGISADEVPHLFQPYWTKHQNGRKGTGLGLYISKGIVEAHGGRIWVDTHEGRGSTFFFTLPL
jgi:PAS domain S-box-containing protein